LLRREGAKEVLAGDTGVLGVLRRMFGEGPNLGQVFLCSHPRLPVRPVEIVLAREQIATWSTANPGETFDLLAFHLAYVLVHAPAASSKARLFLSTAESPGARLFMRSA
jgi:hypothetical protein